ncbi:unnamed protein product [Polarella glacialis]|uniref:Hexosyltransferase n=1 Tax=Polarella glacialis TaxID=89957 RepID=A0A813H7T7_POLGL|nr:unnamed protein product [Polarella glacialis]
MGPKRRCQRASFRTTFVCFQIAFAAIFASFLTAQGCPIESTSSGNRAYVTLASGPEWVLAVRTLGQALRDLGSCLHQVVLLNYNADEGTKQLLASERWDVREVDRIPSPFDDHGSMTRNTFSMLWAYNMTEFERVLYIDSDFLPLKNIDDAFECGEWCAAVSARETQNRFNAGLQVLTPNASLFAALLTGGSLGRYGSYNRGVQGYLNEAIPDWCTAGQASSWEEVLNMVDQGQTMAHQCCPLHVRYNYIAKDCELEPFFGLRTKEILYPEFVAALHYNHPIAHIIKPWLWVWYPVEPVNWVWWRARQDLPGESLRRCIWRCLGVYLPLLSSAVLVVFAPKLALQTWPRVVIRRSWNFPLVLVGATLFVLCVLPSELDALVACTCYFTLKGFLVGLLFFFVSGPRRSSEVSPGEPRASEPLQWVFSGYACEVLEAVFYCLPQICGFDFSSNRNVRPFCSDVIGGLPRWLYETMECGIVGYVAFALYFVFVVVLQLLMVRLIDWFASRHLKWCVISGDVENSGKYQ